MNLPPTYIIAEMACSHDGSEELALQIIGAAGAAGADAVQLQVWRADNVMVPQHPAMPTLRALELDGETWLRLARHARSRHPDMHLIGCVYDTEAMQTCLEIGVDAFKIHSADLSNPELLRAVGGTGKRIDLSVGASSPDEIRPAIEIIRSQGDSDIWLMYGLQLFPTPTHLIHLRFLATLRDMFGLPVGYQDHSDPESAAAFWMPAAAIGFGATILEKHLTHDRARKGIDHEAALNPDEFADFVSMVRQLDEAAGDPNPREFSAEELKYRRYAKKSLVAARDLPEGHTIEERDLVPRRAPDLGLPPDEAAKLLGRPLVKPIAAYHLVTEEDVK